MITERVGAVASPDVYCDQLLQGWTLPGVCRKRRADSLDHRKGTHHPGCQNGLMSFPILVDGRIWDREREFHRSVTGKKTEESLASILE